MAPTLLTDTEELVNTQYPIKESVNTQQFPIKESVNTQQYPIKESVNTQYTIEELVEKTTDGVIAQGMYDICMVATCILSKTEEH